MTDPTPPGDGVPGEGAPTSRRPDGDTGVPAWLTATTIAVLVVVIVVASAVGVLAFTRDDGAGSADEATRSMLTAIEHNDLLGVVELLPPGERKPASEPVRRVSTDLQRLHLVGIIDPSRVAGPELRFDGIVTETQELSDEIHAVDLVGGTFTATWPGGGPPLTESARQILERDFDVTVDPTGSSYRRDFGQDHLRLVAIKEGGGWHVSLAYSAAEALRLRAGVPVLEMGTGPPAVGANLPEDAVTDLLRAYANGDAERLVTLMFPDEARALYDYAPAFLPAARQAAARAEADDAYDVQLNKVEVSVDATNGDTRHVTITALDLDIRDELHKQHITFDNGCFHTDERIGDTDEPYAKTDSCDIDGPRPGDQIAPRNNPVAALDVFGAGSALPTFTVIERNGRWFISPARSLLGSLADTLGTLALEDVEGWSDRVAASWRAAGDIGITASPITPTRGDVQADPSKGAERGRRIADGCEALTDGPDAAAVTTACLRRAVETGQIAEADLPAPARSQLR